MRAAIYARVSPADGRQEVENQLAELRRFAATQGWEIVAEYIDHESGSWADRAEFRRMFRDASQRRLDLVLFWALDRFTREGTLATLKYLEQLEAYGVHWRSFVEAWIDSAGPFRVVVISLLATLAKQERVRISERVRAGMHRARALGTRSVRPIGRPRVPSGRGQGASQPRLVVATDRSQVGSRHGDNTASLSAETSRRACAEHSAQRWLAGVEQGSGMPEGSGPSIIAGRFSATFLKSASIGLA